jgi:formamidopyrimidine-DNA glycosylase
VIAGIGNIYADESLFAAGIAPMTPANTLSVATLDLLAQAITAAIADGLEHGGTSLRDYVQADGSQGEHQEHLAVYGRYGQACVQCGAVLSRGEIAGRTTTWCATCQV